MIVLEVPENPFQYFKSILGMSCPLTLVEKVNTIDLIRWVQISDIKIILVRDMEDTVGSLLEIGSLIVLKVPENPIQPFKSIKGMSF